MIGPLCMSSGGADGITDIVPGTDNVTVDIVDSVATISVSTAGGPGTVTRIDTGPGLDGGPITTTGMIYMPNVGVPGTYSSVTTDDQGRVKNGTTRSFSNPSRSMDTPFQISTNREASVQYSVVVKISPTDVSGANARVYLEYANDSAFSSGATYVAQADIAFSGVADISLTAPGNVGGMIPAGKWVRIRSSDIVGASFYAVTLAQEVLL